MGHYWRDMDLEGANKQAELLLLEKTCTTEISKVALRDLTVEDLLAIIDVYRPQFDRHEFDRRDAEVLKRIIAKKAGD